MGMVRDAATAKAAAEINELLRQCDRTLSEHISRCGLGLYGDGLWPDALGWDLGSIRARLDKIRELISGAP